MKKESDVHRVVRFMKNATDALWRAENAPDPEFRAEYLAIADDWDKLAEEVSSESYTRRWF